MPVCTCLYEQGTTLLERGLVRSVDFPCCSLQWHSQAHLGNAHQHGAAGVCVVRRLLRRECLSQLLTQRHLMLQQQLQRARWLARPHQQRHCLGVVPSRDKRFRTPAGRAELTFPPVLFAVAGTVSPPMQCASIPEQRMSLSAVGWSPSKFCLFLDTRHATAQHSTAVPQPPPPGHEHGVLVLVQCLRNAVQRAVQPAAQRHLQRLA